MICIVPSVLPAIGPRQTQESLLHNTLLLYSLFPSNNSPKVFVCRLLISTISMSTNVHCTVYSSYNPLPHPSKPHHFIAQNKLSTTTEFGFHPITNSVLKVEESKYRIAVFEDINLTSKRFFLVMECKVRRSASGSAEKRIK